MNRRQYDDKLTEAVGLLQKNEINKALQILDEAIILNPNKEQAHYFAAIAQYISGQLDTAAASMEHALEINYSSAYLKEACDIYFDCGLEYLEKHDYSKSILYFEKCLKINPDDEEARVNIKKCIYEFVKLHINNSDVEQANLLTRKLFSDEKPDSNILFQVGLLYSGVKKYKEGLECYHRALKINPNDPLTLYNTGLSYLNMDKSEESLIYFQQAIELQPVFPEALLNYGLAHLNLRRYAEAIDYFKESIRQKPDYITAYLNMATAYIRQGRGSEAIECCGTALKIEPENLTILNNLGVYWQNINDTDRALEYFTEALKIDRTNPDAHFNLSTIYLSTGHYKRGWEEYEWRFKRNTDDTPTIPDFKKPRWRGESLSGKTIYVYPEQGYGDALQFVRFLPVLAEMGANVIYKAVSGILPLLEISDLKARLITFTEDDNTLEYDYYIPLLSIPYILNTELSTIPLKSGYLQPEKVKIENYKAQYFDNDSYKVGIFWHGNLKINPHRHMSLTNFLPLLSIEGLKLYSFQRGLGIEDLYNSSDFHKIVDMGKTFSDFSDTAAAMKNLDLMITIDTSVAHLAGAIGQKTLLILPYWAEWRWMQNIEYSPWYDSLKLVRQTRIGEWDSVLEQVCRFIKKEISNKIDNV